LLAIFAGQIAGALTPLALWWIGRNWFGPITGCVAAVLCALSEVHILLSRSALTDVPLGLWWVLAIGTLHAACKTGRVTTALLAGGIVGLAWWTKYNGWMPLGIAFSGVVIQGFVLFRARDPRAWTIVRRGLRSWLISAITAAAIWSPWIWSLQARGGYRAVIANHSHYVVGLSGWCPSLLRQIGQLNGVAGKLGTLSLLVSFWLAGSFSKRVASVPDQAESDISRPSSEKNERQSHVSAVPKYLDRRQVAAICSALLFGVLITFWPMPGVFGLAVFGLILWKGHQISGSTRQEESNLSGQEFWILAVWLLGMVAATPLYHPYLRLTVPVLLASFLGAALCVQLIFERRLFDLVQAPEYSPDTPAESQSDPPRGRGWSLALMMSAMCFLLALVPLGRDLGSMACYADRTGLVTVAREIKTAVDSQSHVTEGGATSPVVYVFAEPALLFQLRLVGVEVVAPAGSLSFAESRWGKSAAPVYLAIGIHAGSDPAFQEQFSKLKNRLNPAGSWPWHLSPLVSLDQPNSQPSKLGSDPAESATVELFEVIGD
jgi:dolichyl-phosphate-mannose-protein mannosyltransferase